MLLRGKLHHQRASQVKTIDAPCPVGSPDAKGPLMTADRFLTLADVAEILNISTSQTYALVRSGDLQGIQIGGRNQWRVERVKLEEYIEAAYRRTAAQLSDLPSALPAEVDQSGVGHR
jgi:excisionase family DNA binding protein